MNRIAIIGAGRGGTALIQIFHKDPLVKILKIADENPKAPGLKLARELGIPTTTDFRKLLTIKNLDTLIDVTGSAKVQEELKRLQPAGVSVIGGFEAKFMWQLIEAQIRSKEELKSHLSEYQALLRLYMRDARHAVIEERTRIALDLHDGLVQTLVGLNYKMDTLEQRATLCPSNPTPKLKEIRNQLKKAIEESRYIVFNLKPIYFEKMDLMPALKSYLKSYEKESGISTSIKIIGEEARISPKAKVFLFRIVQESLSNVKRHAQAKHVHAEIHVKAKDLLVVINDDGVGFNLKELENDTEKWASFGVRGIGERAKLLGGEAIIESLPGTGTTVTVTLPLEDREDVLYKLKPKRISSRRKKIAHD
ncbi:MAG: hypothetical protein HYS21_09115 [Deltaproteobacteria bacterium]|nr:hypothetical protein [Deltaproteobacteria bacterium]